MNYNQPIRFGSSGLLVQFKPWDLVSSPIVEDVMYSSNSTFQESQGQKPWRFDQNPCLYVGE
jgi:hypothetical protein